jgi:hypothetical protein
MNDSAAAVDYIGSLDEIVWGGLLVAITLVIHGFGMLATLRFTEAFKQNFSQPPTFASSMSTLILASWQLLEGMIATSGLLGFAWSTGVLMSMAQDCQNQQRRRFYQRHPHKAVNQAPSESIYDSETQS